jgi:hypothetical protein
MAIYSTREMAYGHYGYKSYRIEIDTSAKHRPLQRHIWTEDDGTVREQDWIDTYYADEADLLKRGYVKISGE